MSESDRPKDDVPPTTNTGVKMSPDQYEALLLARTLELMRGNINNSIISPKPIDHELSIDPLDYSPAPVIRKKYDEGLELIFRSAARMPQTSGYQSLIKLFREVEYFRKEKIGWLDYNSSKQWEVLDKTKPRACWMGVLSPDDPWVATHAPAPVRYTPNSKTYFLAVNPFKISKPWAGLALVHGFVHAMDDVSKGVPPNVPKKDKTRQEFLNLLAEADELELMAAQALSEQKLYNALEKTRSDLKLGSDDDAVAIVHNPENLKKACSILDPAITSEASHGRVESQYRATTYMKFLLMRTIFHLHKEESTDFRRKKYMESLAKFITRLGGHVPAQ